jgi:sporulation protein YlmC with PRC-barrel domain
LFTEEVTMAVNNFEKSRVAQGTLRQGANEVNAASGNTRQSSSLSRDDVRDGFADEIATGREDVREGRGKLRESEREGVAGNNTGANDTTADTTSSRDRRRRRVLSAGTLAGDRVRNTAGDDLGKIEEIMIDLPTGKVAYVVLSFGGFLGIGDKLFAVPWRALRIDEGEHQFVLDIDKRTLENAPGFDKNNWPDMADPAFADMIHAHYGTTPYWEHDITDAGDYVGDDRQPNRSEEYDPTVGYKQRS